MGIILLTGIKLMGDGVAGTSTTSSSTASEIIVVGSLRSIKLRGENCPLDSASSVVICAVVVVAGEAAVVVCAAVVVVVLVVVV